MSGMMPMPMLMPMTMPAGMPTAGGMTPAMMAGMMNPMMNPMMMMSPMMAGMPMAMMAGMMMPMMCRVSCEMTADGMTCRIMPMEGMSADMFTETCNRMMTISQAGMPMAMICGGITMMAMPAMAKSAAAKAKA